MALSKQEVFDKVALHLLKQNERSVEVSKPDALPGCMYRGKDGLMCAAGALIPDELYDANFEGNTINSVLADNYRLRGLFQQEVLDSPLLEDLQCLHDGVAYEISNWYFYLLDLAKEHGVNTDALTKP